MKISLIFTIILFIAGIGFISPFSSSGELFAAQTERWDLRMIEEAQIWKKLLVNYFYAEHRRFWPERKKALEEILAKFPESRWADDAALVLACGKASFEDDLNGAIAELEKVAEKYPTGHTIVVLWDPQDGCRYDDTWLAWQGSLVFLNPDGSVRTTKPFQRHGEISHLEKESLNYFHHLDKFPRSTMVTAQLFISQMLALKGDLAGAAAVLEEIVTVAGNYLPKLNRADRLAASQPGGYHIRNFDTRPEYRAYISLIGYYEKLQQLDKANATAEKLISSCTQDGWFWKINRYIGDYYQRHEAGALAEKQYRLALDGLLKHKADVARRNKLVQGSEIPEQFWQNNIKSLERKLKKKSQQEEK